MITTALTFLKANKLVAGLGAALLLLGLVTGAYFKGRAGGIKETKAEYAAMALETAKKAREASEQASANKDERDNEFADQQAEIEDAVKQAIDNGDDATVTYFNQLRKAQSGSGEAASE